VSALVDLVILFSATSAILPKTSHSVFVFTTWVVVWISFEDDTRNLRNPVEVFVLTQIDWPQSGSVQVRPFLGKPELHLEVQCRHILNLNPNLRVQFF
jgi:hypothetical protein